jgi:hypothetical protein
VLHCIAWPKQCPVSVKSVPSMFWSPFCIHWPNPIDCTVPSGWRCACISSLCQMRHPARGGGGRRRVTCQVIKLSSSKASRHRPLSRTVGADKRAHWLAGWLTGCLPVNLWPGSPGQTASAITKSQSQNAKTFFTIIQDGWASFPLLLSCRVTKQSRPSLFPYGRSARHRIISTFVRLKTDS